MAPASTPLSLSISWRIIGCLYAIIAKVSRAALESLVGEVLSILKIKGAYEECVLNW